ncbi:MAG TPA: hypothetical protein QF873_03775 [Patescibacteria group bacterium]|nr:hypothetical protein [Patescibacteria group bacterium]
MRHQSDWLQPGRPLPHETLEEEGKPNDTDSNEESVTDSERWQQRKDHVIDRLNAPTFIVDVPEDLMEDPDVLAACMRHYDDLLPFFPGVAVGFSEMYGLHSQADNNELRARLEQEDEEYREQKAAMGDLGALLRCKDEVFLAETLKDPETLRNVKESILNEDSLSLVVSVCERFRQSLEGLCKSEEVKNRVRSLHLKELYASSYPTAPKVLADIFDLSLEDMTIAAQEVFIYRLTNNPYAIKLAESILSAYNFSNDFIASAEVQDAAKGAVLKLLSVNPVRDESTLPQVYRVIEKMSLSGDFLYSKEVQDAVKKIFESMLSQQDFEKADQLLEHLCNSYSEYIDLAIAAAKELVVNDKMWKIGDLHYYGFIDKQDIYSLATTIASEGNEEMASTLREFTDSLKES